MIISVVCLDKEEDFTVLRIWLLHTEVVLILADHASEGDSLISKQECSDQESPSNAVNRATSCKQQPIEIVCSPESLEEYFLLDNPLLLGSVKATSIDKTKLQPGCHWITMGVGSFILLEVDSRGVVVLRCESESVTTIVC